jgi:hypothetical protein
VSTVSDTVSTDLSVPKDERLATFVESLALTGSIKDAAAKAGIHERTGHFWIRRPDVVNLLHSARDMLIRTKGAAVGLQALVEIAKDPASPAGARVQASKELLALAGHSGAQAAADAAKARDAAALQDMSADQLERMIAGAAATLSQLRRQANTIDVAPDPAPASPDPSTLL